ncbi:GNAT family N-acetyltransferase [Chitinophaga silvatica]|uniref:GNAT family N-acetyltransferase n=1 Tax=Chitinophaga silvatica TaxID=2282649 RepID=A0A3E1Y6C6_9BACT|nr:GNAT family N-acetyltransferase [Chitinophaga silvatica]RFS20448.1 GNAT family N-acetyltransferase [Chitinophaga silvatica]
MEVTQATELHTNEVAVLFDAYRSFYDQAPDFKGALEYITDRITKKDSIIYIAMLEEEIIGFLQLYPIFTSIGMKRAWILNDIYVLEEHRGIGAGKALMAAAYKHAKDTESGWIMLQTYISNTVAQALYEKEGFVRDTNSYYYYKKI